MKLSVAEIRDIKSKLRHLSHTVNHRFLETGGDRDEYEERKREGSQKRGADEMKACVANTFDEQSKAQWIKMVSLFRSVIKLIQKLEQRQRAAQKVFKTHPGGNHG